MSVIQAQVISCSKCFNLSKIIALMLNVLLFTLACDDADENNNSGEMTAGEMNAGEMNAGEITAGEMNAGEITAGEMTAGEMNAGEMNAGEMNAGEITAGEMNAGEMTAGEMNAGEMNAGEMLFDGTYSLEAPMTSLNDEGQQAFCESFVARNQAADEMTSSSDRETFKEKSCLLAGLFGGAADEASCEADRMQCLMDFENAMFTAESCMSDFASAFMTCNATVGEIEACEVATRTQLLNAILSLNTSFFSCSNVGEPGALLLAAGLPTAAPDECTIPSVEMCQEN